MTNLYMQLGDGTVFKDFVLLDILVRMDVYTHVDALVGVIATGEYRHKLLIVGVITHW